jgi:hypothetical protein
MNWIQTHTNCNKKLFLIFWRILRVNITSIKRVLANLCYGLVVVRNNLHNKKFIDSKQKCNI